MEKNSLTLLLTLGCLIALKIGFGFHGEELTKYQQTVLFMLIYLSIRKLID